MAKSPTNLSIGFHNISGKHSSTHGCKLGNLVKHNNDIEILAETRSKCKKCKNTISKYEVLNCIEASKRAECKKGRASGGMLLYCKSNLKPSNKILKSSNFCIWYEIDKSIFYNLPDNIKVCSIYSPPENSNYYTNNIWDELKADIFEFTTSTSLFMIIGDSNARVGDLSEFSDDDNPGLDSSLQANTRSFNISKRNNCDKEIKQNGQRLMELSRTFHMQIANGRFLGDIWGNYTHHNISKGESTVDLAIVSDTLLDYIDDFKVLPQKDFSDHCKIVLTI